MPSRKLERRFARKMLPLAIVAGLVVFAAPSISYYFVSEDELGSQARIYAEQLAGGVQLAAEQAPYLWRYNISKILMSTASHRSQRDISAVTISDCKGAVIFGSRELELGTGEARGPSGWAPVRVGSQIIAGVWVAMDASEHQRRRRTVAMVFLLLGSALGIMLYLFPTRVVSRQARLLGQTVDNLERAERELHEANLDLSRRVRDAVSEVHAISERLVNVQEEERLRIARDLHDGVGQVVTALRIALRLAGSRTGTEREDHLADATALAEEILAEIRAAVFALRPAELGEGGLEDVLRDCVERFEIRTRFPASFRAVGDISAVPEQVGSLVFRVLQESLTNVARHSEAREVGVEVSVSDGVLALEVADDGRGFDADTVERGSGLRGIRERVLFAGGKMELESTPESGTRLRCTFPIAEVEQ